MSILEDIKPLIEQIKSITDPDLVKKFMEYRMNV